MIMEFELTADDIVDFNMHHLARLQSYLRTEKRNKMIIAATMFLSVLYLILVKNSLYSHFLAILVIVFCALMFSGYSSYMRRSIARKIRKEIKDQKNSGFIGNRRIEIEEFRISESGSNGDSSCLWTAVRAIEKNERLIIVYISAVSAYIIPRRVFKSQKEFDDFYTMIMETRNALL
jgi:hypothetical protein